MILPPTNLDKRCRIYSLSRQTCRNQTQTTTVVIQIFTSGTTNIVGFQCVHTCRHSNLYNIYFHNKCGIIMKHKAIAGR
uniref:Uncharacterized protein n=1 Tax=Kalanchoe fedtschenkoi TaxID=63787 RepID=A0A7N0RIQ7_KALFE